MDLHARTMDRCIFTQDGAILVHRHMPAGPEPFLKAVAPDREDLVVCVEGLCTGYGLADLCAREGMPLVLGHALSMQASHGGPANNDQIEAQTMAVLRRGGRRPQADVEPAERRATRDLLRRRPLRRTRAALRAHLHQTNRQDNVPERGQQIAYNANRDGGAERFPAPAGQKNMDVDLALLAHDDRRRRARALAILKTATQPDATTRSLLRPVPGMGELLSLVLLDDIHDLQRFPRVPECVSYGRVVNWAQESAGKRAGTSGSKIGKASLQWAFAAAAGRCWRANPAGQQSRARVEKQHRTGQALTVLAPK